MADVLDLPLFSDVAPPRHITFVLIPFQCSRWERTSVSKLDLRGTEVREMLALDSIERGRRFTELLHRAVSVGGLDDRSRADVAVACARACLVGAKVRLIMTSSLSSFFTSFVHSSFLEFWTWMLLFDRSCFPLSVYPMGQLG